MTVDEAAAHLRQMLLKAGFRFDHPDPALVWEVFKRFVAVPVESAGGRECEQVWFEACDGHTAERCNANGEIWMYLDDDG